MPHDSNPRQNASTPDRAIDQWLRQGLGERFDVALRERLPESLLALLREPVGP